MKPKTSSPGSDGFTILELLLVLGLVSVIMGLSAQMIFRKSGKTPEQFKDEVQSFLNDERVGALGSASPVMVYLAVEGRRLISSRGSAMEVPRTIEVKLHSDFADATHGAAFLYFSNGKQVGGSLELSAGDKRFILPTNLENAHGS